MKERNKIFILYALTNIQNLLIISMNQLKWKKFIYLNLKLEIIYFAFICVSLFSKNFFFLKI